MPPKKAQAQGANKKTIEKKKDKIIEDKTFGLKNKKGKKQQQFIKTVTQQVKFAGQSLQKKEADAYQAKKEKAEREKEKAALDALFKPVQTQKISAGADPKSVLCLFHKQGLCTKGDKCKFSHDLSLEGKAEKRSMYVDAREQGDELEQDTMDKWDEDKLKEVVKRKQNKPKTDIVCKHFLHAIEKGIYGWFWECPSGERCIYRHALPPGFVFKRQLKEQEDLQPQESITLEELVEKEREDLAASGKTLTKVTLESFLAWKKRKIQEKVDKADKEMSQKKEAYKAGKTHGISGRELFEFNPEFAEGDDEEAGDDDVINLRRYEDEDVAVDVTGITTVSTLPTPAAPPPSKSVKSEGATTEQTGSVGGEGKGGSAESAATGGGEEIPVDESLFTEQPEDAPGNQGNSGEAEGEVPVDESLFDIENLGIDDDPSLQQTLGETVQCN